jgi:hypothetical protein
MMNENLAPNHFCSSAIPLAVLQILVVGAAGNELHRNRNSLGPLAGTELN